MVRVYVQAWHVRWMRTKAPALWAGVGVWRLVATGSTVATVVQPVFCVQWQHPGPGRRGQ